ncbi:class I SAM-dependent methyltransferase [Pseudomonadales bacterium]|nr:class I SAM-dependent methyltransferase [Pseudomonadales bacterium]
MEAKHKSVETWHQEEKAWWDEYGEYMTYQWQTTPNLNRVLRHRLEEDYMDYLHKPGGRLLDLGCGSGWLSMRFARQGMSVLGIDVSQEQINAANVAKEKEGLQNLKFICADFATWEGSEYETYFDSVFLSAFMHHLPEVELELIFERLFSLVKPGGKVYMYEPLTIGSTRGKFVKFIDAVIELGVNVIVLKVPKVLGFISARHKKEIARGYTMASPNERPVSLISIRNFCVGRFSIPEVQGRHLYSLGFGMQVTTLKHGARKIYELMGFLLYQVDRLLLWGLGWEAFSTPERFILCSLKFRRL